MIWRPEKSGRRYFFSKVTLTPSKLHLRMVHYYLEVQTMSKTILIIEDEEQLCRSVAEGLRIDGYETDICFDGDEGLCLCMTENYDLILLDLNPVSYTHLTLPTILRV